MMVIGAILAETDIRKIVGKGWILYYSLLRLIVIPLVVYGILEACGVDAMLIDVSVLMAAMPREAPRPCWQPPMTGMRPLLRA